MYTKKNYSGKLYKNGVEITQDDRDSGYMEFVAFLSAGGTVEIEDDSEEWAATQATDPEAVLEDSESWGRALVRQVELGLLTSGINDDRKLALAIDRELAEVGAKLKDGRLHIALAALEELLEKPEQERYSADAMLKPIEALIRARIQLEEAARR